MRCSPVASMTRSAAVVSGASMAAIRSPSIKTLVTTVPVGRTALQFRIRVRMGSPREAIQMDEEKLNRSGESPVRHRFLNEIQCLQYDHSTPAATPKADECGRRHKDLPQRKQSLRLKHWADRLQNKADSASLKE